MTTSDRRPVPGTAQRSLLGRGRRFVHRAALRAERWFDAIKPRQSLTEPPVIEPYVGYVSTDGTVVRGRVLTRLRRREPRPGQSMLTNVRQMIGLFLTNEVEGVTVSAGDHSAESDEEGYFRLKLPRLDAKPGWASVPLSLEDHAAEGVEAPVLVPDPKASYVVVSDIDDTVIETGAYSLARNLWTTLTGNALTRHVFADSVALLERLSDGGTNPVFYVSSSPWNLHDFLLRLFAGNNVLRGPIFLRDLGLSETKFIKGTHGGHKGGAIDRLMEDFPDLPFVLIGDTGQHDAEVYADAARRWPGRVAAVALRKPSAGLSDVAKGGLDALAELSVPAFAAPDFREIADDLVTSIDPPSAGKRRRPKPRPRATGSGTRRKAKPAGKSDSAR